MAGREGAWEGICNNDDFVPTLSRFFHQGLVDKARQMNYDKDYDDIMYCRDNFIQSDIHLLDETQYRLN